MNHELCDNLQLPDYSLLRVLAERDGCRVFLARDKGGILCAIKTIRSSEASGITNLERVTQRLQPLTQAPGLLQIQDHGTHAGLFWKRLPLADNLPGLPSLDTEAGIQQYTPLTLRARSEEQGPSSAQLVALWGERLAKALEVLHDANLVHRDVKPSNVFFIQGEACLGDFGLVSEPGAKPDHLGTEGYRPLEGTSNTGTDLFALGKTLYEAWTGRDRLEFPSLPRKVLEAPDWAQYGNQLNEIILKACAPVPGKRFKSAQEFRNALSVVVSGERPVNRRAWAMAFAGLVLFGTGTLATKSGWFAERKPPLMNIDFGGSQLPDGPPIRTKVGPAAEGKTPDDFWNHYTDYDGYGGLKTFDTMESVKLSDGTTTAVTLSVSNAPGCWENGSPDPMYYQYVYATNSAAVVITASNLLSGRYDVLVYAHDGKYDLRVGEMSYGVRSCFDYARTRVPGWEEGSQYVRFTNVVVRPGDVLELKSLKGYHGHAIISGMQILGPFPGKRK